MQDKTTYLSEIIKKLSKWDKNLDILQTKVDKLSQKSKEEYQTILDDLKDKKDQVEYSSKSQNPSFLKIG